MIQRRPRHLSLLKDREPLLNDSCVGTRTTQLYSVLFLQAGAAVQDTIRHEIDDVGKAGLPVTCSQVVNRTTVGVAECVCVGTRKTQLYSIVFFVYVSLAVMFFAGWGCG